MLVHHAAACPWARRTRAPQARRGGPGDRRLRAGALPAPPHRASCRPGPAGWSTWPPSCWPSRGCCCLDEPTAGIAQREAEAFIPLLQPDPRGGRTPPSSWSSTTCPWSSSSAPRSWSWSWAAWWPPGRPKVIRADPKALAAYLGASDEALMASGPIGGRRRCRPPSKEGEDGSEHGGFRPHRGAALPSHWRRWAGPGGACAGAPAPRRCAPRSIDHRHRRRAGRLARPGPCGHAGRVGRRRRGGGGVVEHQGDAGQPGQHEHARGVTATSINVVFPVVRHQQPGRQGGLRRGQGVQRADHGHQVLCEPDQRNRWDQRPHDQPDHRPASTRPTTPTCRRCASSGPRATRPCSPWSTETAFGNGTTSSARPNTGISTLISAGSTTTNWTQLGSPYLWWSGTGPGAGAGGDRAVGVELGPPGAMARRSASSSRTRPADQAALELLTFCPT